MRGETWPFFGFVIIGAMSHNSFGHLFRVTTFGESHGPALGCVVDGCPSRLPLEAAEIQKFLDLRRPGQSRFTTQRQEADAVKILSGVMTDEATGAQMTTGTPIALLIENTDQRSKDYGEIKHAYRPGHADYVYDAKYGIRDYRGGGRSSARETAARVAAGAVARKVIPGVTIRAAMVQVGPHKIDRSRWDWAEVERNGLFCPDAQAAEKWADYLDDIRKAGSSIEQYVVVWRRLTFHRLANRVARQLRSCCGRPERSGCHPSGQSRRAGRRHMWVIHDGLSRGERVVVEGQQNLRPGVQDWPRPFRAN